MLDKLWHDWTDLKDSFVMAIKPEKHEENHFKEAENADAKAEGEGSTKISYLRLKLTRN